MYEKERERRERMTRRERLNREVIIKQHIHSYKNKAGVIPAFFLLSSASNKFNSITSSISGKDLRYTVVERESVCERETGGRER